MKNPEVFEKSHFKCTFKLKVKTSLDAKKIPMAYYKSSGQHWIILWDELNTRKMSLTNCIQEAFVKAFEILQSETPAHIANSINHQDIELCNFVYCDSMGQWSFVEFKKPYIKPSLSGVIHMELSSPTWRPMDKGFWKVFEALVSG